MVARLGTASSAADYDGFAEIYNQTMAEDFCQHCWPAIQNLLLSRLPPAARVLDLCCGSGQMARAMGEQGLRVTGIDRCLSMLRIARRNAPKARLFLADARGFSVARPHQAGVCTFNSLAHFHSPEELSRVFTSVRAALCPLAPFLFDLTMEEGYLRRWHGTFELTAEGLVCTVRPSYDALTRLARNEVVVFRREGATKTDDGAQKRFTILQKCHNRQEVVSALRGSGFSAIDVLDAVRDLGISGDFGRCFFLAT